MPETRAFFPTADLNKIQEGEYLADVYNVDRANKQQANEDAYIMYREYYDGEHDTQLTERAAAFLETDPLQEFNLNACPIVVDAKAERLTVTGFEADQHAEEYWNWWQHNDMDGEQGLVHLAAVRDGDAYVMAEWDSENKRPRWSFELAYDGGEGVKVHYSKERRKEIAFASKRWVIDEGGNNAGKSRRLNLYYADHVEKYISTDGEMTGQWQPYFEEGAPPASENGSQPTTAQGGQLRPGALPHTMTAWYWWTDTQREGGKPLGVPVVHFKNLDQGYAHGKSELKDVIPIQNALNKSAIDLVLEADIAAFRLLTMIGDDPSDLTLHPGAWIYSENPDTKIGALEAGNLDALIRVKDSFFMDIARISRTPISYFQITGQRPAEGTLQQEESGLVSKAERCQTDFGNTWVRLIKLSRRMHNAFAGDGAETLGEDEAVECVWKDAQTRNRLEHLQSLLLELQIGVDDETVQAEAGYNEAQIAKFRRLKARKQALAIRQFGTQTQESANGTESEEGQTADARASPAT